MDDPKNGLKRTTPVQKTRAKTTVSVEKNDEEEEEEKGERFSFVRLN